ncbi:MAG: Gfo/Idh/MocA family protein [Armatimonadota bacterium]
MIKVGVIGLGRSGWELHAEPLSRMSGYQVVAVCEQAQQRLEELASKLGARPYRDPEGMIADAEVELVVVAVPGSLHTPLTVAALNAGKHVVVEKPMANTLAEAEQMLAAAEAAGRTLTVFHNRRWDRDYQLLKALVRQGELGELLTLDSRVMTYGPEWTSYGVSYFNPTWRIQAAFGGGFLADWGPHLVEQCLDLIGEWPLRVTCQLRSHLWAKEVEDYFNVRLEMPSGLLVTLEGSNNARLPLPRWFVVGTQGTLVADGAWGKWTDMRIRRSSGGVTVDLAPQGIGASSGARDYDVGEELSAQFYADLAEALSAGRAPAVTAQRGRDVIAILETARQSHRASQTVQPPAPRGEYNGHEGA